RLMSCARRWLGCCGPSSSITTTSINGLRSIMLILSERRRKPLVITIGITCTTRTSSRCQISGNTPWYAAWDLAFHVLALSLVDDDFGKQQLDLMLRTIYLYPHGRLPACEWNFGDVYPRVRAWSTIFASRLQRVRRGKGDIEWLERSFQKLLLNFTWWVNRKDRSGRNAFEGGFLGLDNIG